jgi:hypothetical protein
LNVVAAIEEAPELVHSAVSVDVVSAAFGQEPARPTAETAYLEAELALGNELKLQRVSSSYGLKILNQICGIFKVKKSMFVR